MSASSSDLGAFLMTQRARRDPSEVSVPDTGFRRVPGLRREEVAVLAGISSDYYARLEQGREVHPSSQVVEALARALGLDSSGQAHLQHLAGTAPTRPGPATRTVSAALHQLVDHWTSAPAVVYDDTHEVLAANRLAMALHPAFVPGENVAAYVFLDPEARSFYDDWESTTVDMVRALRLAWGRDSRDPRLLALVAALDEDSPSFHELWHHHGVLDWAKGVKRLHHPRVGTLDLTYQSFAVGGSERQHMMVLQAAPDSPTADALRLLGSLAVTDDAVPSRGHQPVSD